MGSRYCVHLFSFLLVSLQLAGIPGINAMEYKVINNAKGTEGGSIFERKITEKNAEKVMASAYDFIRSKLFKEEDPFGKKGIRTLTLIIVEDLFDRDYPKGILLNADYFEKKDDTHLITGFTRNIYNFMTLLFLRENENDYPQELSNGIAEFVLLEASCATINWEILRVATTWYNRRNVTGQFFMYCEREEPGFVAQMIKSMKRFSSIYLQRNADRLWKQYKESYNH